MQSIQSMLSANSTEANDSNREPFGLGRCDAHTLKLGIRGQRDTDSCVRVQKDTPTS